ncbi:MAG: hypothetical protein HY209_07765 [Candidatus Omnitrophica bacterium]|nr:hypothetical protein [Candidatus Omnitrophota bacterium]
MKRMNLILLIILTGAPLTALAAQGVVTPPVFVFTQTSGLGKDETQLKNDVLNQERANRDAEIEARNLAEENVKIIDTFANYENFRQLKTVLLNYGRKLDERNRKLMARNEETIVLRNRIEKLEHLFDAVIKLNSDVEVIKVASGIAASQDQKNFLIFKNRSLVEKYKQLLDFKAQLARTKEELQKAQHRYQALLAQNNAVQPPSQELSKINDHLKSQTAYLEQYQMSLQDKDSRIGALNTTVKHLTAQVANLEQQLQGQKYQSAQLSAMLDVYQQRISNKNADDQESAALQERLTVAEAKLKVSVDQSELKNTKELLKASSVEVSSLRNSLKEKDDQIQRLKKQSTHDDSPQRMNISRARFKNLLEDLYFKDKQIERLKKQMAQKDRTLVIAQRQLKAIKEQLNQTTLP